MPKKVTGMPEYLKLRNILDEMKEPFIDEGVEYPDGVFEDRREYTKEDLKSLYELTDQESRDLYYLVQREFDSSHIDISPTNIPSWIHKEYFMEAEFGGYEGFSEHEYVVIQKWLDDMCRYWKVVKDEPKEVRDPVTGRMLDGTYGSKEADQ